MQIRQGRQIYEICDLLDDSVQLLSLTQNTLIGTINLTRQMKYWKMAAFQETLIKDQCARLGKIQ